MTQADKLWTAARATIGGGVFVIVLVVGFFAFVVPQRAGDMDFVPAQVIGDSPASSPLVADAAEADQGFLYGRITDGDGVQYEGRLRWGQTQEAFWGDYFNGTKSQNPWAVHAPQARSPQHRDRFEIFGFTIGGGGDEAGLARPFMARFGDIARIEAHFRNVQVTLKSGTRFTLDRFAAGDIDDGVRVWDAAHGMVDLDTRQIAIVEFLSTPRLTGGDGRLHGTVRTAAGSFSGFIQWDRHDCVDSETLDGHGDDGRLSVRYSTIRTVARRSRDSVTVTLRDGRELPLSETSEAGNGNRGMYVDDARYGRVLISWAAFERVDFTPAGSGPPFSAFAPGRALAGTVATRDGRRITGRLVYDFDESETTETLDASLNGVDYMIPFALIASVRPRTASDADRHAAVVLRNGDELPLDATGDLGAGNAGMLIFAEGSVRPEYVPWTAVERVEFAPDLAAP